MRITSFDEYKKNYQKSVEHPEQFWDEIAHQFEWKKDWDQVLEYDMQKAKNEWFIGGQLNITENCIDRHLKTKANDTAIIWEPNDPKDESKNISYQQLHDEVCRVANGLRSLGVRKGDRVCIYMPMVPELTYAVLACARIGAIHSVVFAGFSAKALADRINDASCKVLLTADGSKRGDKSIDLKSITDEALETCPSIEKNVVLNNTGNANSLKEGRDLDWADWIQDQSTSCETEVMESEDPLFILYTSGSTGRPKGVVHATGGYMVYATYSFVNVFQYQPGDIYWCTADIGWITGHSYIIYGPLCAGATTMMFEGVPTWPDPGRFWEIVARHKVNQFYTAPTAIRALMAREDKYVEEHDLSSLTVLGTVGEPINEEAWNWYNEKVGRKNCPVVDTWWQTETGGIMIAPLANITPTPPTFATLPLPGIQPVLKDANGETIEENGVEGNLCIEYPWPGMIRTTWGDHERCKKTYFSSYPGTYFTGDGCKRNKDGYYRITGRVDDVINVSGHRIGTAEVEDAIDLHESLVEAAVVGYPHDIKGQGIMAYLTVHSGEEEQIKKEVIDLVKTQIGSIAKPDKIMIVNDLPKTRSGKIMRRILRKLAAGEYDSLGDTSTLLNPDVVEKIKEKM